jgi:hypothetical protein
MHGIVLLAQTGHRRRARYGVHVGAGAWSRKVSPSGCNTVSTPAAWTPAPVPISSARTSPLCTKLDRWRFPVIRALRVTIGSPRVTCCAKTKYLNRGACLIGPSMAYGSPRSGDPRAHCRATARSGSMPLATHGRGRGIFHHGRHAPGARRLASPKFFAPRFEPLANTGACWQTSPTPGWARARW